MLSEFEFQCPSSKQLPVTIKRQILMTNGITVVQKVKNFVKKHYPEDFSRLEEVGWKHCPISFITARKWKLRSETVGQLSTTGKYIQKRNGIRYKEPLVIIYG